VSESQDLREFIREMTIRSEGALAAHREELREYREAMHRHFDEQARKLDDVLAENRAQREALFKMMDRLDNGGGAAA
jgi:hypothetical protein